MQYEDLIKRLRSVEPAHSNPSLLTDHILNKIQEKGNNQGFFFLKANQQQWQVFKGIRILVTSAAIFLIAFFLYQQWEISQKLQRLEEQVALTGMKKSDSEFLQLKKINAHFIDEVLTYEADSADQGTLVINRKTLNFLREKIQELEQENLSIREKLLEYDKDSTLIIKQIQKP
jgi:hypothetical protein